MSTDTALEPVSRASLHALCEELAFLVDSEPTPENEALHCEWLAEMGQATEAARTKVDRVVMFIRRLEAEIEWAKGEAAYHAERAKTMQTGLERVQSYCVNVVQQFAPEPPTDSKGKPRHSKRLEGRAGYLAIQQNPPSIVVDRAVETLPAHYQRATIAMDGVTLCFLRDTLIEQGAMDCLAKLDYCTRLEADRASLKKALEAGAEVEGADLKFGDWRLALPRAGKAVAR